MTSYVEKRRRLVKNLIREGVLSSEEVIRAMLKVPRELFVPETYREYAYVDTPLPTFCGQTISAPHMCAIMCEALDLKKGLKVLEVGCGSGYHAALCAEIVSPSDKNMRCGWVLSIEIFFELCKYAVENLEKAGYSDRVYVINGDGSITPPSQIMFDRILVTAAAPRIPPDLVACLAPGGKMIVPVGDTWFQTLTLVIKDPFGQIKIKYLGGCVFVPLRGLKGRGSLANI